MADYLQRIRELSGFLFMIAVLLVLVVVQVPSDLPVQRLPVYVLLASAFVTGIVVHRFPWRRFHPNWFLVVGTLGTVMIALLIYLTGGRGSVFHPLFVFVVVASGAYYGARPLAYIVAIVSLASLSFILYAPIVARDDLLRSFFAIGNWVVVAFLCHAIFRGLERSTEEARHYADTLAVVHDLDVLHLAGTQPDEVAAVALHRLADVAPFRVGWIGLVDEGEGAVRWLASRGEAARALPTALDPARRQALLATREGPLTADAAGAADAFGLGGESWLLQGLVVAEAPIGVLLLARSAEQRWGERDRRTIGQLAGQIALGLDRGRLAEQSARLEAQQELARMKEEFVHHLSHELRTPLTMVLGGAELLMAGAAAPDQVPTLAGHVHRSAVQLKQLVDDVLDLAAGERAGWALEWAPCDLVDLLDGAVWVAAGPERRGHVSIEAPSGLPPVMADPLRLRQVFVNLVGNALKYSPRGARVRVVCGCADGAVEVRVVDQGIGIPPEALGRVFEKFYRAPNRLARGIPGTGLGLAITRQLVEAHGGRIWVESAGVGRGSTFGVSLPVDARSGAAT